MDPQLLLFRRQYLQLCEPEFLAWPPSQLLKDPGVQKWLYNYCFNAERNDRLPPVRYQYRVLKLLVTKIEKTIEDPEEDEINDDLMNLLSTIIANQLPSELAAAQQQSYVTFSCISRDADRNDDLVEEPTITLLERRQLISGSLTTGYRTWEAALHLGQYLLTNAGRQLVAGKNVLELGAGTGFLAILCAKHLGAKHVTTTDGDEGVVDTLRDNLFLNGLDDDSKVLTSVLRWGQGLKGTWVEEDCEAQPYDIVLGADITYDKRAVSALVATLRLLFDLRPSLQVIITGAVRNAETFETFRHGCLRNNFTVSEIDFPVQSIREQKALFYAHTAPLRMLHITRREDAAT